MENEKIPTAGKPEIGERLDAKGAVESPNREEDPSGSTTIEETEKKVTEIKKEIAEIRDDEEKLRALERELGLPEADVPGAESDIALLNERVAALARGSEINEAPVVNTIADTATETVPDSREAERKPAGPEERNRMLAAARTREELAVAWEESAGGKGRVWVNDNLVETEACARKIRAGETDGLPLDLRQQVDRIRRIEESPETPVQSIVEEGPSVTPENQPRSLEGEESYFEQFLGTVGSAAELKTYLRNHASSENTVVLWDNDGNEIRSDVFDLGSTISHVIRGDEGYTVDTLPRSRSLREAVERIKQVQSELAK